MAPGLKPWIGSILAAWGIIAFAVLASGGGPHAPAGDGVPGPGGRWTARAAALADLWRGAEEGWQIESYRDALAAPADSARGAGGTAPILVIDGPATSAQRAALASTLGEMWGRAAPEGFKVAVALVIVRDSGARTPSRADAPDVPRARGVTFVFPDTLHRAMCVAVLPEGYGGRQFFRARTPLVTVQVSRWLEQGLGPCAFYGAFGSPGREIGRWVNRQGSRFMIDPHWWDRAPRREMAFWTPDPAVPLSRQPVAWWTYFYGLFSWDGVACYAGQESRCATAVFDSTALADSQPSRWSSGDWWRDQELVGGTGYLSDLVGDLGADRFSRFWSADIPVDSAFALAAGTSLADWTQRWVWRTGPRITAGPGAPARDVVSAVILAALAFAATAWYAGRRQIR
ncbi:MAG TPA: hypothetical protein VNG95_06085 [Gemmatimonadales bacterium]|nr:hypothetical protein [Gemmatimonadales bacterium]